MIDKLLKYLADKNTTGQYILCNDFFKEAKIGDPDIARLLFSMETDGLIIPQNDDYRNLGSTFQNKKNFNLFNTEILLKLGPAGHKELATIRRRDLEDALLNRQTESIEKANNQNIETGKSIVDTNNFQQKILTIQVIIGVITLFVALSSLYVSCHLSR